MTDLLLAVILDLILGDPQRFPHPIRLFGATIGFEERLARRFAKGETGLRLCGFVIVLFNIGAVFTVTTLILELSGAWPLLHHLLNIYLIYTTIAARCLRDEAMKIYHALQKSLDEARYKLSFIVGRDTKSLEEKEIIRATIETVAENTSDGVIAPLLFAMLGGAPLALVYKMVNTMDSMLGYMNEKYRYLGFFPAKTDDLFNFIPARLAGVLMNLSGAFKYNVKNGFRIMLRDHKNHKSPNCAYPEGAAAGLLQVQLGGTNLYFGEKVYKPSIGDAIQPLTAEDIHRTVEIMFRAELLLVAVYIFVNLSL